MSSSLPCGHSRDKRKVGSADGNRWWLRSTGSSKSEISVGIQWWEVTQEGRGSFTNAGGAINTTRKSLLCQGQTAFFISSCTSISFVGLCVRLKEGENKVTQSTVWQGLSLCCCDTQLWWAPAEPLTAQLLLQTPLLGLLREKEKKINYWLISVGVSAMPSSCFQSPWRFIAVQLITRCLWGFCVC